MDKVFFLLLVLVGPSRAQFFSRPFADAPQPPRQGPFFQRPQQQQQPGILRQLANLFGLDGGFSSGASPPPPGPPSNQQLFPPGPGQRDATPFDQGNFQRAGPRPSTFLQRQPPPQRGVPLGNTQILTFQPEDVRPRPGFDNIPTGPANQPPAPHVPSGFLRGQSVQTPPIRSPEALQAQPFANVLRGVSLQRLPLSPEQGVNPIELVAAPSLTNTATIADILKEDCEDFEERGYCESTRRYPMLQIADLVKRCSSILDALYVPVPELNDVSSSQSQKGNKDGNPLRNIERANQAVWSWAKYATEKSSVCKSESRRVAPSYARDTSKKWVVVLQSAASNVIQHVSMERCKDEVEKECLSGPEGGRHPGTRCTQRHTHHHLVTWDPDKPRQCPSLRAFSFPTACLCHFSLASLKI